MKSLFNALNGLSSREAFHYIEEKFSKYYNNSAKKGKMNLINNEFLKIF